MNINNNKHNEIYIQNVSSVKDIPNKKKMSKWITEALLATANRSIATTLRIVDIEEGETLNKTWRNKEHATNVLSFPVDKNILGKTNYIGDIVICAQIAEHEAKAQKKSIDAHWAHLVIHGILHLQGYDHEKDNGEMEKKEIQILMGLGYENPYET